MRAAAQDFTYLHRHHFSPCVCVHVFVCICERNESEIIMRAVLKQPQKKSWVGYTKKKLVSKNYKKRELCAAVKYEFILVDCSKQKRKLKVAKFLPHFWLLFLLLVSWQPCNARLTRKPSNSRQNLLLSATVEKFFYFCFRVELFFFFFCLVCVKKLIKGQFRQFSLIVCCGLWKFVISVLSGGQGNNGIYNANYENLFNCILTSIAIGFVGSIQIMFLTS